MLREKLIGKSEAYLTPVVGATVDVRQRIKVRKGFTDLATDTISLDVNMTRHAIVSKKTASAMHCVGRARSELNTTDSVYRSSYRARN